MNGSDHYTEAEELLDELSNAAAMPPETKQSKLGQAQVHATLALAEATSYGRSKDKRVPWSKHIGTNPADRRPSSS